MPNDLHRHANRSVSSCALSSRVPRPASRSSVLTPSALALSPVSLVAIGLVIIAGIVVIALQFTELNTSLSSLAETGEMAQPLIADGTKLASNFNNLTGDLTSALGLGSGNGSLSSGVKDFTSQIADAGKQLFSGLQGAIQNVTQNVGGGQATDDTSAAAPATEADMSG